MPRGGPERSARATAANALAAAVVVHLAGATDTARWVPHDNTNCGTGVISDEQFESLPAARVRCQEHGPDVCFGIYNMWCEGETVFLCSKEAVETADDLDFSSDAEGGSCTEEMIVATVTTIVGPNAGGAAPPTTAPSGPTSTTDASTDAWTEASTDTPEVLPCGQTCMSPLGASRKTCLEQILRFAPPGSHTGSMPHVQLTCEQKRAMVSHLGDCGICGSCDVCEATSAPIRKELVDISYDPGTPSNLATGLFIAASCVATGFCAASVGRRFGFDPQRSQQAGEYILASQVAGQAME